jgi:hypothetical protein
MQDAAIKCEDKMFGEADSPMEGESQALDSGFVCNVSGYFGNAKRCNFKMLCKKMSFCLDKH